MANKDNSQQSDLAKADDTAKLQPVVTKAYVPETAPDTKFYYTGPSVGVNEAFGVKRDDEGAFNVPGRLVPKAQASPFFDTSRPQPRARPAGKNTEAVFEARQVEGGQFSVMRGDVEVIPGLTSADADTFNAMSDEDKAEFVNAKG